MGQKETKNILYYDMTFTQTQDKIAFCPFWAN